MTNRNINKNAEPQLDSINNQFEITSSSQNDLQNTPHLYGMTLEQYKEGVEIHSRCFGQLEKIINS
ncbi:hypothetical protein [Flavobacterium ginsenosidimutans]|uniref:hypothetical protein n=1 Tax=Flavobacterium ginsenosidimutans TaxID=687844 RepID=UPI003D956BCB